MSKYQDIINGIPNIDKVHKIVVSLSGGLDSTTLLYLMVRHFGASNVSALSFSYQQRHDVELLQATKTCKKLGVQHKIIDIGFLGEIVGGVSAMVKGDVATPAMGDLEAEKQVPTYVPFRNTILSSITMAFAESVGADGIALGVQYGDYENSDVYYYWDCSKKFTEAVQAIADLNDKHHITFIAPFVTLTKVDEIKLGEEIGVPYEDTWTCYNPTITNEDVKYEDDPAGGKNPRIIHRYTPCGICPSCAGRLASFQKLGMADPVAYGVVY
jgi:7-cyano-7-deazaguanine synthase